MYRFLFVNTREANCSIYEKGVTFFEINEKTDIWQMDYVEVNYLNRNELYNGIINVNGMTPTPYDAIIWNYHPYTMKEVEQIDCTQFYKLNTVNYCMVVEEVGNEFVFDKPLVEPNRNSCVQNHTHNKSQG